VRQIYTGCTRAQERCIVIGPLKAFTAAVLRDPPIRNTDLAEKFFALCPDAEEQDQNEMPPALEDIPMPPSFALPPGLLGKRKEP